MYSLRRQSFLVRFMPLMLVTLFFLSACVSLGDKENEGDKQMVVPVNQPYYPKDFRDILIPDGLEMSREDSLFVKTNSFNGGILSFQGRIEVNSLIEFFESTMPKDDWELAGSVKSKKSLLIFKKPEKVCMITVAENSFTFKTEVRVYISEAVAAQSAPMAPSPSTEEPL